MGLQLLGLAHLSLERHGVCWEHGTVTELQAGEPALPASVALSAEPGFRSGAAGVRFEDVDGHHHCPVQASRRDWAAGTAPDPLAFSSGPERPGLSPAAAAPRADGGLLLRAPKQSPPRAA